MRTATIPAPGPFRPAEVLRGWGITPLRAHAIEVGGSHYLELELDDSVTDEQLAELGEILAAYRPQPSESELAMQLVELLGQSMTALQSIRDAADIPAGNRTAAQLSNDVRALQQALKVEARALLRVLRLIRADYSGTD